ncbi:MAG: DUF3105 domain-containing protein, partial [Acidimicrobiales bacterium]
GNKKNKRRPPTKRPAASRPPAKAKPPPPSSPPAARPAAGGAPAGAGPPRKTQAQRLEEARRARARKSRNTRLAVAGAVLVLVGLLVFNTLDNRGDADALRSRLTAGGCTFDTRSDRTDSGPPEHVPTPGYEVDPPAGGNHDPSPAPAGTYTEASKPDDTNIVHSLQHGYITIWHRPDLDEAGLAAVAKAVEGDERDVLVVPRATLTGQVAATAWGERLLCPTLEAGPLREFVKAYANKGPEPVPHPEV